MSIIPLIIDSKVPYTPGGPSATSMLTLPLAEGSILDHLAGRLAGVHEGRFLVMPDFEADGAYQDQIRARSPVAVRILDGDRLDTAFDDFETSDYVLAIEVRRWLVGRLDLAGIRDGLQHYRGATHAVAVGADPDQATEHIERDPSGRVKRVQRLYAVANWPEVAGDAVVYSVVPGRALAGLRFNSLAELRRGLAQRGVLSRDVPVMSDMLDLSDEQAYLELSEQILREAFSRRPPRGFVEHAPGILRGTGCRVDTSVRLTAPVVLQDDVTIGKGATVIGPAVVGRGSFVGRGARIAQSVVLARTSIEADTIMCQRVIGSATVPDAGATTHEPVCSPASPSGPRRFTGRQSMEGGIQAGPQLIGGRALHLALKRFLDVTISALALLLLSPLLLATVALIKLTSPGPVFFCHRRERRGGKEFPCIKFRTMTADAHQKQRELYEQNLADGPQFKMTNDPRVTRLGQWLRATNIDELPQLVNVLIGHMSLVGPRPSPFRENQICVPWRRARLSVRPGITGLWQVCRDEDRSRGDFHEWIYYDMTYVRHLSLWLDIRIVLATLLTLGGRRQVPLAWLVRPDHLAPVSRPVPAPVALDAGLPAATREV